MPAPERQRVERRIQMEIAPSDIAKGMKVYGTDGEKLGTVAEVYTGDASRNGAC